MDFRQHLQHLRQGGKKAATVPPMSTWDVSQVESMEGWFEGWSQPWRAEDDLTHWDVRHVTNLNRCFASIRTSTFPWIQCSRWNVSAVTTCEDCFHETVFVRSMLSFWAVRNVLFADVLSIPLPIPPILTWLSTHEQFLPPRGYVWCSLDDLGLYNAYGTRVFYVRFFELSKTRIEIDMVLREDANLLMIVDGFPNRAINHYFPPPSRKTTKSKTVPTNNNDTFSFAARWMFGTVCAYAHDHRKSLTLKLLHGAFNAKAYCLYHRFGFQLEDPNQRFEELPKMVCPYSPERTLEDFLDVMTGKTPSFQPMEPYCTDRELQRTEAMSRRTTTVDLTTKRPRLQ